MKHTERVYGEPIKLDGKQIKDFFNRRAIGFQENRRSSNTTVLLGDANENYAEKWDKFEKEYILPFLSLKRTDAVLDIGCGIGRWAKTLLPLCGSYIGLDLSDEMILTAQSIFADTPSALFINASFQELFSVPQIVGKQFHTIIITGVCMYLNDNELCKCFEQLSRILAPHGGILYLEESIGIQERLSLNAQWSSTLDDYYSAVYRTKVSIWNCFTLCLRKRISLMLDHFMNSTKNSFQKQVIGF